MQLRASEYGILTKVILLGIDKYQSQDFADLTSPSRDIEKLHKIFSNPNAGSIIPANIDIIPNNSTKTQTLEIIAERINSSEASDTLIFYFAGHGLIKNNKFFLCLSQTQLVGLEDNAISSSELDMLFKRFSGRGLLFLLDCCRSAGFAELAPSFFTSLNNKDFKILLSASRSEQNSWELVRENGTLFTKYLVGALSGEVNISKTSGLTYFSELFDYMSNQIEEDLNIHYSSLPKQELVFAGVFNKDPLLFVHKDLTLRQISVRTTRYSREYINRILKRLSISFIVISMFIIGVLYSILDKSQYAIVSGERILIYNGIQGINLLGFPKQLWTLDLSVNDLKEQSILRSGRPVTGNLGKDVLPIVISNCKPSRQVEYLISLQQIDSAKTIAIEALTKSQEKTDNRTAILKELENIVEPKDSSLLTYISQSPNFSISEKRQAIALLSRINLTAAASLSFAWKLNAVEDYYTQKEILLNSDSAKREQLQDYLNHLLKGNYVSNLIPFIFETAIQYKIRLKQDDIISLMHTSQFADGFEVGYYMKVMREDSLKQKLVNFLYTTHQKIINQVEQPNWDAVNFALTALTAYADTLSICDQLIDYAVDGHSNESMRLLLDGCPTYRDRLKVDQLFITKNFSRDPFIIEELAKYKLVSYVFVKEVFDELTTPYHRERLINSMGYLGDTAAVDLLIQQIAYNESDLLPSTRVAAIKALRAMKIPYSRADKIIPFDWDDVTIEALKWQYETNPLEAQKKIISLINQKDKIRLISNALESVVPSTETIKEAQNSIEKSGDERNNALGILSMYGSKAKVEELLCNKDIDIRTQVSSLVAFNSKFRNIVYELSLLEPRFPNEAIAVLSRQLAIVDEFDNLVQKLPKSYEAYQWAENTISEKYKDDISDGVFFYFEKQCEAVLQKNK